MPGVLVPDSESLAFSVYSLLVNAQTETDSLLKIGAFDLHFIGAAFFDAVSI